MSAEPDNATGSFPTSAVPEELRRSAFPIFFIVTGTLCSLPVFVLSGRLMQEMGPASAVSAFIFAGLISGVLAALGAFAGARTGLNVAILSEHAFGSRGSMVVRLILAFCLLGWYVVIANLLGATVSGVLESAYDISVSAQVITCFALLFVAGVTYRGVQGLQWLASILVPLTIALVIYAMYRGYGDSIGNAQQGAASGTFSRAVSEIIGIYIIGIVIQPDFGRFARSAFAAAGASFCALAIAYPIILTSSGLVASWLGTSDLVEALIALGVIIPAIAIIAGGATIDSSFSLYSGSIGLANFLKLQSNKYIILGASVIGLIFSFFPAQELFIRYLTGLGLALPPLAIVIAISSLLLRVDAHAPRAEKTAFHLEAIIAWAVGITVGYLASRGVITVSGISAVDAIIATALVYVVLRRVNERSNNQIINQ